MNRSAFIFIVALVISCLLGLKVETISFNDVLVYTMLVNILSDIEESKKVK